MQPQADIKLEDLFNFLGPRENYTLEHVIKNLSESARCLITGENTNLTVQPVDLNTSNLLPSNVASIKKELVSDIVFQYVVPVGDYYICFESSPIFENYNRTCLANPTLVIPRFEGALTLYAFWDYLTRLHVKGIKTLSYNEYILENLNVNAYFLRKLKKREEIKSKIVR